jgi:drug/metabolite transporter (DMT)-like permease
MSDRSRNLLQIHGAVFLFGLAGVLGKLLTLPPVAIVCGRAGLAAVALAVAAALGGVPLRPGSRRSFVAFVALGILLAAHWTAFFQSVRVSSVAVALITFSTFPVFTTLLEPVLFRERLRAADVVLALVAVAGIAILVPRIDPGDATAQGAFWGVVSGLTFALLSLLNRKYVRQHSSVTIAFYQDAFAALALLPFVALARPALTARDLLLLPILGVLCTAVAHALFIAGMRGVTTRTASMIACLEPVYGSVLAVPLVGEVPSARTAVGGLIVLGVAFYATLRGVGEGGPTTPGPGGVVPGEPP